MQRADVHAWDRDPSIPHLRYVSMRARHLVVATLPFLAACTGSDGASAVAGPASPASPAAQGPAGTAQGPSAPIEASPELADLGVVIAPLDSSTGRAGDFDLAATPPEGPIAPFGRQVADAEGQPRASAAVDFHVAAGTVVRAPFAGVVTTVRQSEGGVSVVVSAAPGSRWFFQFDHLGEARVAQGATVQAGDAIGSARSYDLALADERTVQGGFVSLTVGDGVARRAVCPLDLVGTAGAASVRSSVWRLFADWRAQSGAPEGESSACVASSVPLHCTARSPELPR